MFVYEKKIKYPVKVKNPNTKMAAAIIPQYGGPDGELGASLRYLSQRYSMPYPELKGLLTDIGTEGSNRPLLPPARQGVGPAVGQVAEAHLRPAALVQRYPLQEVFGQGLAVLLPL